jgi:hypothetical protein
MSEVTNPVYNGMCTMFESHVSYSLHGDAFQQSLTDAIRETVGLRKSWLGDWWVYASADNPSLSWSEMIDLALNILHSEATRLFVSNLYLESKPINAAQRGVVQRNSNEQVLPIWHMSGAKRINALCGEYPVWNQSKNAVDIVLNSGDKFRLSGKDESCCVEGSWFDWCCFACNVLASENTNVLCPDLYEPALGNDNY